MRADALEAAIVADLAEGFTPAMINATTGTTVLGAFDPIEPISKIAKAHQVWLHIDAAYGGSFVFHPELKAHFENAGLADSITWDAHKIMGVPLTCSVILVKQKGLLTEAMSQDASYLFQGDSDALNPGTRNLQCGRRNSALKLWCAWKVHGDQGYSARTQALRRSALEAQACIQASPHLRLLRVPESINICFEAPGVATEALLEALHQDGQAMIGHAQVDGRTVVRLVVLNPDVSVQDIRALFATIEQQAKALAY
jgi:glutamate/tyrosine decarboxylase-like PLP-dependent enzyme